MALRVTADISANMKTLRSLEQRGLIEIHVVNIENHKSSKKHKRKKNPIGIFDGPFSFFGEVVFAADDTPYHVLNKIIGKEHHADVLHLESHIESGHDFFITEDNDFLSKREVLREKLEVEILTPDELTDRFK